MTLHEASAASVSLRLEDKSGKHVKGDFIYIFPD